LTLDRVLHRRALRKRELFLPGIIRSFDWFVTGPGGEPASCRTPLYEIKTRISKLLILNEIVVEAAGVEPASENVTGQETTCLFQFMPWALPQDVRG
jgi:hypothetical protein